MKNIRELLEYGSELLKASSSSARLDAELILSHALKGSRLDLVMKSEDLPSEMQLGLFEKLLKRRVAGEPIAYITGKREFFGLEFKVTPAVLIPRPETEHLVERALELCSSISNPRIIDLGTGSGCISISLAVELAKLGKKASILALDKSQAALEIAGQNAKMHAANSITFLQSDWFEGVSPQKFDLIISNPPYIAESDKAVSPETSFEPRSALYAGVEGLDAYRAILARAKDYLAPAGVILFEIGYKQSEELMGLAKNYFSQGEAKLFVEQDLSGHDRIVLIKSEQARR